MRRIFSFLKSAQLIVQYHHSVYMVYHRRELIIILLDLLIVFFGVGFANFVATPMLHRCFANVGEKMTR